MIYVIDKYNIITNIIAKSFSLDSILTRIAYYCSTYNKIILLPLILICIIIQPDKYWLPLLSGNHPELGFQILLLFIALEYPIRGTLKPSKEQ